MRRLATTAFATLPLVLGLGLGLGLAAAATDGSTCRTACAPRIEEQCGRPGVRGFKKCRKKLVRACKRTTPESACPSTAALTRVLEDRVLRLDEVFGAPALQATLCRSGDLRLREDADGSGLATEDVDGTWSVRLAGGAPALELEVRSAPAPRRLAQARNPDGTIRLDGRPARLAEAGGVCPASPAGGAGDDDANDGPGAPGDDPVTAALADRFLRIGRSDLFSSGSITETQEMALCASGRFTLVVTTVTATSIGDFANDFDSQETFDGTWSVRRVNGADVLELATGEPQPRRLSVEVAPDGTIVLDGTVAEVGDARGQCSGAPGGGTPADPVAQAVQALSDRVLVLQKTNIGFGRRTTVIVLCASRRYALESETTAAPGAIQQSLGGWSIRSSAVGLSLVLTDDASGTRALTITVDAQDNLLLDGLPVAEGDPALVGSVCPQI